MRVVLTRLKFTLLSAVRVSLIAALVLGTWTARDCEPTFRCAASGSDASLQIHPQQRLMPQPATRIGEPSSTSLPSSDPQLLQSDFDGLVSPPALGISRVLVDIKE